MKVQLNKTRLLMQLYGPYGYHITRIYKGQVTGLTNYM